MTADVPPIVVRAGVRAAHDHHGIVGYRLRQTTELHAARFYNRSDSFEMVAVFDGDTLLGVRILQFSENGRPASGEQKATIQKRLEGNGSHDGFAVPFDSRHFSEYRYESDGVLGARFTSIVRDTKHGDGRFTENSAGDVVRMVYTPNVLPQHADAATITDERAEVLPGFWATVLETQHYEGHYGPFHGHGDIRTTESHFVRFSTRAAALAALDHGGL